MARNVLDPAGTVCVGGKAQEAYAALEPEQSEDYGTVKEAVLAVYELVQEVYRPHFRSGTNVQGKRICN